jgi:hypothetical protein
MASPATSRDGPGVLEVVEIRRPGVARGTMPRRMVRDDIHTHTPVCWLLLILFLDAEISIVFGAMLDFAFIQYVLFACMYLL